MATIVKGGHTTYGYDIGIIMLDTVFPRIVGDIGNADTWKFPVLYKVVEGYKPNKVVLDLEMSDIEPFVEAALYLRDRGVRAITTSCGFLAMFQEELNKRLDIPVYTSSLVMLPMLCRTHKKVLVLSANSETLTRKHIESACGRIDDLNFKVIGTQDEKYFTNFTVQNWTEVDVELCRADILKVLHSELDKNRDDYGCILMECTNLPPYADCIRKEFGLPVFDIVSLINMVHESLTRSSFGEFGDRVI